MEQTRAIDRLARRVRAAVRRLGIDVVRYDSGRAAIPPHVDFGPDAAAILARVRPYTMTSPERLYAVCQATAYVVRAAIPGALVECGVWRGGSMMAAALTLLQLRARDRQLYLFDTYAGMPEPGEVDVSWRGLAAAEEWRRQAGERPIDEWCRASVEDVRRNIATTGYPIEHVHLIAGKVEETIPAQAPDTIALLRLDTDWYESTRHELEHLFPRLALHGVLIIDDYGHWEGARRAVDEYFDQHAIRLLLNRTDYTGRIAVKTRP